MNDVPDKEAIIAVAQDVLNSIVLKFDENDESLPTRRIITTGDVVHDCEQLVITFVQLYIGGPGAEADQPQKCDSPRTGVFTVELIRCIPKITNRGSAPSPEDLLASATQQLADAWLLVDGAMFSASAEFLGALTDVSVSEPKGGYQAVRLNLVIGIP